MALPNIEMRRRVFSSGDSPEVSSWLDSGHNRKIPLCFDSFICRFRIEVCFLPFGPINIVMIMIIDQHDNHNYDNDGDDK